MFWIFFRMTNSLWQIILKLVLLNSVFNFIYALQFIARFKEVVLRFLSYLLCSELTTLTINSLSINKILEYKLHPLHINCKPDFLKQANRLLLWHIVYNFIYSYTHIGVYVHCTVCSRRIRILINSTWNTMYGYLFYRKSPPTWSYKG